MSLHLFCAFGDKNLRWESSTRKLSILTRTEGNNAVGEDSDASSSFRLEIAYNVTHIRVRDEKFVGEMAMSRDG